MGSFFHHCGGCERVKNVLKVLCLFCFLYLFFLSIGLIGSGFKGLGNEAAQKIIEVTSSPFVALFIGILATSMVQSSSTVTSMIVSIVGAGILPVHTAIPMVMGANVGTSVTNTFVSIGHITRKGEFSKAVHAATVHDIFNILSIAVLFPLEMLTRSVFGVGLLEKAAVSFSNFLGEGTDFKFKSPVKLIIKPVISQIKHFLGQLNLSYNVSGTILIVTGFIIMFLALFLIVKLMKSLVIEKIEVLFDKVVGKKPFQGLVLGIILTAIVQSSSITTSIMVPMAAAGVINIYQVLSITLGANIGTTVTALLASSASGPAGVSIALVHLFFNISGCCIFWPGHKGGKLPVYLSEKLSLAAAKRRYIIFIYVLVLFFLLPLMLILIDKYLI